MGGYRIYVIYFRIINLGNDIMKDRYCKKCGVTPHEQTGDAQGYDEFSCSKCFTVHYVKQVEEKC